MLFQKIRIKLLAVRFQKCVLKKLVAVFGKMALTITLTER